MNSFYIVHLLSITREEWDTVESAPPPRLWL